MFPDAQLRTLQRRVKAWRTAAARELVLAEPRLLEAAEKHIALLAPASPPPAAMDQTDPPAAK